MVECFSFKRIKTIATIVEPFGFYQSSTGHIVGAYAKAAKEHGFRPYAGYDASGQPPDAPDVLPHDTAVAF